MPGYVALGVLVDRVRLGEGGGVPTLPLLDQLVFYLRRHTFEPVDYHL